MADTPALPAASGDWTSFEGITTLPDGLANDLFLQADGAGTAGRTLDAVAELADVDLQFVDGAAEGVAVHTEFAGGAALIALVFLEHGQDETLLELTHALGVKNIAFVHLQN